MARGWLPVCVLATTFLLGTIMASIGALAAAPVINSLTINSSSGSNTTGENLTTYLSVTDADGDNTSAIYDWRVGSNGSILLVNIPADRNNSGGTNLTKSYTSRGVSATVTNGSYNFTGGWNGTGAYQFNGTVSYLNLSDAYDPVAYTIEAWVKPVTTDNMSITARTASVPTASWSHQLRISNGVFEHYTYDGAGKKTTGTTTVVPNTWYHVVGVAKNNAELKLYVNGVEESDESTSVGTLYTAGDRWFFGSNSGDNMGYFNGTIDSIRIYNRTLSPREILALYKNRTDLLVREETRVDENWSVCVTAMDNSSEATACTGNLSILPGTAPSIANPVISSKRNVNRTTENLIANGTVTDPEGGDTQVTATWKLNGTSILVQNANFDTNDTGAVGSIRDFSGYGNNGTTKNGALWKEKAGRDGTGAYYLDGANDYLNFTDFSIGNNFSVEIWIDPFDTADNQAFIGKHTSNGLTNIFLFGFYSGGYHVDIRGQTFHTGTKSALPQHLVVTGRESAAANTTVIVYKDGAVVWTTNLSQRIGVTTGLGWVVGQEWDNGPVTSDFFNGIVDDFRVYNRTLTPEEVAQLATDHGFSLHANETTTGDNWSACVTPNDGWNIGATVCSSGLLITDDTCTPPAINNNWNIIAADECSLTQNLNLGSGNVTVNGTYGVGTFHITNANLTAHAVSVVGNGGTASIALSNARIVMG